jgi:hypothetical protein
MPSTGGKNACAVLARQSRHPLRHGARSTDRGAAGRDRQGDELRDLRLRPAPLRRPHARHGIRRHHGPRVHGRGGRGRAREHQAQGGRSGGGAVHHHLRRVRAVPARQLFGLRAIATRRWRTRSSATPRRASTATPISPAAILGGRRNTCACPTPMSARSRSRASSATSRCCSSVTSSPRVGRRWCNATSSRADLVEHPAADARHRQHARRPAHVHHLAQHMRAVGLQRHGLLGPVVHRIEGGGRVRLHADRIDAFLRPPAGGELVEALDQSPSAWP